MASKGGAERAWNGGTRLRGGTASEARDSLPPHLLRELSLSCTCVRRRAPQEGNYTVRRGIIDRLHVRRHLSRRPRLSVRSAEPVQLRSHEEVAAVLDGTSGAARRLRMRLRQWLEPQDIRDSLAIEGMAETSIDDIKLKGALAGLPRKPQFLDFRLLRNARRRGRALAALDEEDEAPRTFHKQRITPTREQPSLALQHPLAIPSKGDLHVLRHVDQPLQCLGWQPPHLEPFPHAFLVSGRTARMRVIRRISARLCTASTRAARRA